MSINSLSWCLCAGDVSEMYSCQVTIWEKSNKRSPSSPKFEISAQGAHSKIYGNQRVKLNLYLGVPRLQLVFISVGN